jgi:SAM-dependent methyltransferase
MMRDMPVAEHQWHAQWSRFRDDAPYLFDEWIAPATREMFRGKDVLEAGCGGGHHTELLAQVARSVTAVDLHTVDLARTRAGRYPHVRFVTADLGTMDLGRQFDAVVCVGVIQHTDDPDRTFDTLFRHCKPGGLLIVWTYSAEGNSLVRHIVEPLRRAVLRYLPTGIVVALATLLTALLYPVVHTVYRLQAFAWLPYFEYFGNFRRLSFRRNVLNVFDKLNAPQTTFITAARCAQWLNPQCFRSDSVSIRHHQGISWSLVGTRAHA